MAFPQIQVSRGELRIHENLGDLSADLVEYISELSEASVKEHGAFAIAISGGSLIGLMSKLCEAPYDKTIDWTKWYIYWEGLLSKVWDLRNQLVIREITKGTRTTHSAEVTITLSGLLNFIDGLWSCCGDERIIVFTTNYKDKLDPALLRPGRMDMHIHMSYLAPSGFRVLALNYQEARGETG